MSLDELIIHIDGASRGNPGPASVGVEIKDGKGQVMKTISEAIGTTTNNVAEYFALIYAMEEAAVLKARRIHVYTDSELLAKQYTGVYRTKEPLIKLLHHQVRRLVKFFEDCKISHVNRENNKEADRLANQALNRELF